MPLKIAQQQPNEQAAADIHQERAQWKAHRHVPGNVLLHPVAADGPEKAPRPIKRMERFMEFRA